MTESLTLEDVDLSNFHQALVVNVNEFIPDSFIFTKISDGIIAQHGSLKNRTGNNISNISQSYFFDSIKFTPVQGQEWLKNNHRTFVTWKDANTINVQEVKKASYNKNKMIQTIHDHAVNLGAECVKSNMKTSVEQLDDAIEQDLNNGV